ncbi:hypothetical protein N0V86_002915 [Didymella sp. IMI 355093]|nr:hypothetical protein N0V86_002915 [Didymella sp. IMI 355093]
MKLNIPPKLRAKIVLSKEQRRKKNSTPRLVELTDEQAAKYESGAANGAVEKKPTGPHPRDMKREKVSNKKKAKGKSGTTF